MALGTLIAVLDVLVERDERLGKTDGTIGMA
jgi:hypothetical protein